MSLQEDAPRNTVRRRKSSPTGWHWLALGAGTGLVIAAALATAYRWQHWEEVVDPDPRAEKVHELIQEAERLLAQGRSNS